MWVTPVLAAIAVGFSFLLVVVASPFATQMAPLDGAGLNPSLQNPYMLAHPPFLYLGYVGLAVPFAFSDGRPALGPHRRALDRRDAPLDADRVDRARRRSAARLALGLRRGRLGRLLRMGSVENAALMPFLAATAFLHSVMIQEKRGMLKVWNVVLVALAFCLSLFGTFLTRSGVVNSIHSFAQSVHRAVVPRVHRDRRRLLDGVDHLAPAAAPLDDQALVARSRAEAVFLYNNLLLVALCLTILWGVAWPILSEAVRGTSVVVGRPYFDFFLRIFGLPLLLLMGIGLLIAARVPARSRKTFLWPFVVAVVAGVVLLILGAGSSIPGLIAYTFAAFVLAAIGLEFVRGTKARKALSSASWPGAFFSLIGRNRRRYGGYVVHVAIVFLAIGIAGSSAYDSVVEGEVREGAVTRGLRLQGHLHRADRERHTARRRGARPPAREPQRRESRHARGGQELVQDRRPRSSVSSEVGIHTTT